MAASFALASGTIRSRDLPSPRFDGDGQGAADAAHAAIQGKFTDEKAIGDVLLRQSAVGAQDPERHGQIES